MPPFASKYPAEVGDAIAEAVARGLSGAEILTKLHAGTLPGIDEPVAMPKRTLYDRVRAEKEKQRHTSGEATPSGPVPGGAIEQARRAYEQRQREAAAVDPARVEQGKPAPPLAEGPRLTRGPGRRFGDPAPREVPAPIERPPREEWPQAVAGMDEAWAAFTLALPRDQLPAALASVEALRDRILKRLSAPVEAVAA